MNLEIEFKSILTEINPNFSVEQLAIIQQAFNFIIEENRRIQKQPDENQIQQAFEILSIVCKDLSLGIPSIVSVLIYKTLPYSEISIPFIQNLFGKETAAIVNGLLKIPAFDNTKISSQSENIIKMLLTLSEDVRVVLIKLAEIHFYMRNLNTLKDEKQKDIAVQAMHIYAPLAHRLGLYAIKSELEDRTLKYFKSDIYQNIELKLIETKEKREKFIADFIRPIKVLLLKNNIRCEIKGRPKSIASIYNKMRKQNCTFEEVYDLFAIRIIIDTEIENEKAECWRVYSLITDVYTPNPHRLRDWVSTPKSSGYESLHTTVIGHENTWVEVQIRTRRMDEIAEKGQAAHWKYKERSSKQDDDSWMKKVREALEKPALSIAEKVNEAKAALYTDEIFIFTPKGDLKRSKRGNTVIDFAYQIHSEIGSKCSGAIVNDKFVSIKHELKNGDRVKILTSKSQRPKYEWLDFAKDPKVHIKIRKAIREIEYKDIEAGKEIIKQKFSTLKIIFNDENIQKLTDYFEFKNQLEMYQAFAEGKVEPTKIKKAFEIQKVEEKNLYELTTNEQFLKITTPTEVSKTDYLLIDNNLNTIDYQFAKCCNPIRGDAVFGFVTVNKGTKIHKKNCPNANDLHSRYAYRIIKAKWTDYDEDASFLASIRITGKDSMGIAASVTHLISNELKVKVKSINVVEKKNQMFEGMIIAYVNGTKQLDQIIERLKKVKDVLEVSRVY